jgi:hypothetical protein
MPEPQADALIDKLRRANRRWKVFALSTLAALVLAIIGLSTFTAAQVSREKARAEAAKAEVEQALKEAKEALEAGAKAREHAEQVLYASQIQMAQKEREERALKKMKP